MKNNFETIERIFKEVHPIGYEILGTEGILKIYEDKLKTINIAENGDNFDLENVLFLAPIVLQIIDISLSIYYNNKSLESEKKIDVIQKIDIQIVNQINKRDLEELVNSVFDKITTSDEGK